MHGLKKKANKKAWGGSALFLFWLGGIAWVFLFYGQMKPVGRKKRGGEQKVRKMVVEIILCDKEGTDRCTHGQ